MPVRSEHVTVLGPKATGYFWRCQGEPTPYLDRLAKQI